MPILPTGCPEFPGAQWYNSMGVPISAMGVPIPPTFKLEHMEYHIGVIANLAKRPGMYAGSTKLQDVATFFNGYIYALSQCGVFPMDNAWGTWIGQRFDIWHTAWSWDRTLLHSTGSEEKAIASSPELFRLYVADVRDIGVEGIERRHRDHFHTAGEPFCYAQRVPDKTFTSDLFD